jgi:acyl-CoA oxidase
MGTIARYAGHRRDLQELLEEMRTFSVVGEFMLTELDHGLDARSLETTATMQDDGSFILNTPSLGAAKAMPPTTPWAGLPRVAVVFAKLMVDGQSRGIKPFIVRLCEADGNMCPGITCRVLPKRAGARYVDHAITSFSSVHLGPEALLEKPARAANERAEFFRLIGRVTVGTFLLSAINIPMLRMDAYIAGRYSMRRMVSGPGGGGKSQPVPIISFSTQLRPILDALAQATVFEALSDSVMRSVQCQHSENDRDNLGVMATIWKATVIAAAQPTYNELVEGCGWQGLFAYNRLIELPLSQQGNSIAEGHVLVLCIKLAAEILLGRVTIPPQQDTSHPLARREIGAWGEACDLAAEAISSGSHRDAAFNALLLPRSRYLIEIIGQRMAYEAGKASERVDAKLLALYEARCISADASWFAQHEGASRSDLLRREAAAVEALRPRLAQLLDETGARPWADSVPILTEQSSHEFLEGLPTLTGLSQKISDSMFGGHHNRSLSSSTASSDPDSEH